MASGDNLTQLDEESRWLKKNGALLNAKCETFYAFPDWYPAGVQKIYKNLLWVLLAHFDQKGLGAFSPRTARILIDFYKRDIAQRLTNPSKKPDLNWRRLLGEFSFLERNIILELVRLEYAAMRPAKDGMEFIADLNLFHGHGIQVLRSKGGKNNADNRRNAREKRAGQIVNYIRMSSGALDRGKWASTAAKKYNVSPPTARAAIKAAGLYDYPTSLTQKKVSRKAYWLSDLESAQQNELSTM